MLVELQQFREVFAALKKKYSEGNEVAFFPEGQKAEPDLKMFGFATDEESYRRWHDWHDDDFWEYVHYGLKALVGVMSAIEKGKVELNYFLRKTEEGSKLINVEDIYRLKIYPFEFIEGVKKADFYHKSDPNNPVDMDYYLGGLINTLDYLSLSTPGAAVACRLWEQYVPPGTIRRPEMLPSAIPEISIPRKRVITFKKEIGKLRSPGRRLR